MNVDKYCEDGLLFDVFYNIKGKDQGISKFMFSIYDTEESVKEILSLAPYNIDVTEVAEIGYVLKLKSNLGHHQ